MTTLTLYQCNYCGALFRVSNQCRIHEYWCAHIKLDELKEILDESDIRKWVAEKRHDVFE
jgi:hypothetical protein